MRAVASGAVFVDGTSEDYGRPDGAEALRVFDTFPWAQQHAAWLAVDESESPLTPSLTFRIDEGHFDLQVCETPGALDLELCLSREGKRLGVFARKSFDTAKAVPLADVRALVEMFLADEPAPEKRERMRARLGGTAA